MEAGGKVIDTKGHLGGVSIGSVDKERGEGGRRAAAVEVGAVLHAAGQQEDRLESETRKREGHGYW